MAPVRTFTVSESRIREGQCKRWRAWCALWKELEADPSKMKLWHRCYRWAERFYDWVGVWTGFGGPSRGGLAKWWDHVSYHVPYAKRTLIQRAYGRLAGLYDRIGERALFTFSMY